jgi:hypothetical protein
MSELTRYQAKKIVEYLLIYHPWGKIWEDVNNTVFTDVKRILDENQSIPALKQFVWYEATPENCARIPEDKKDPKFSIYVAVKVKDQSDWERCSYNYKDSEWIEYVSDEITYFMLIE